MQYLIFGLGPAEIGLVAFVFLLLFGGSQIPKLMKGLAQGIKEFKKAKTEVQKTIDEASGDLTDIGQEIEKEINPTKKGFRPFKKKAR